MTTAPRPEKCQEPTHAGGPCPRPSVPGVDPDGAHRCFAHSRLPEFVAKRASNADKGRLAAMQQRGVPRADRGAVAAGVIPPPAPIPIGKGGASRRAPDEDDAPDMTVPWPADFDPKSVDGPLSQGAWMRAALLNLVGGSIDDLRAKTIHGLIGSVGKLAAPKLAAGDGAQGESYEDKLLAALLDD